MVVKNSRPVVHPLPGRSQHCNDGLHGTCTHEATIEPNPCKCWCHRPSASTETRATIAAAENVAGSARSLVLLELAELLDETERLHQSGHPLGDRIRRAQELVRTLGRGFDAELRARERNGGR